MRSFLLTTLLLALTCASSHAQFNFPTSATDNNRFPTYPAQSSLYGSSNPNSIDSGYAGSRYPVSGSGYAGLDGAGSNYPASVDTGASQASPTNGNPNTRIFGLLGGGGRGGGGGLFSNLLGALTGRNRGNGGFGGFGGGSYPYPPPPYPGYSPYGPSPYAGGYGYPGYGGGFYG